MDAGVVDALKPVGQTGIEFVEGVDEAVGEPEGGFEIFLAGAKEAFDFAFAPTVIRAGVEEAQAEFGADQAGMIVGEGTTLIGVDGAGETPAAQGILEGEMKTLGVGPGVIEGRGDQTGVIVDDGAEMGWDGPGATGDRNCSSPLNLSRHTGDKAPR